MIGAVMEKLDRFTIEPLQENDPVFRRRPVNFSPSSVPKSGTSKTPTSTKDEASAPTPTPEKASRARAPIGAARR